MSLEEVLAEVSRWSEKITMEVHAAKADYERAKKEAEIFRKRLLALAMKLAKDESSMEAKCLAKILDASATKTHKAVMRAQEALSKDYSLRYSKYSE